MFTRAAFFTPKFHVYNVNIISIYICIYIIVLIYFSKSTQFIY
jgi:hypothetical protein